jgi:hypothetical protein
VYYFIRVGEEDWELIRAALEIAYEQTGYEEYLELLEDLRQRDVQ